MTLSETANAIGMIQEIWPSFLGSRNIVRTAEIWHSLFENETMEEMEQAIQAYACRDAKGFPPPIGAIKELVWQQRNERMSEQTAWELVKQQFAASSAHPRENFEKLPVLVQACVGTPTTLMKWGQMNEDELESVIASQFKRSYRDAVQRKRENDVLPGRLRAKYPEYTLPGTAQGKLNAPQAPVVGVPCPPEVKAKMDALRATLAAERKTEHADFCD